MKIKEIQAREILDSRGIPTVEAEIILKDGSSAIASIPAGTSVGKYEAKELRDKDPDRFSGMGVLKAVENVNKIIRPKIIGMDASYQQKIDQFLINLDGTENKSNLGANAILAVSQAVCEASAVSFKMPTYKYLLEKYKMGNKDEKFPSPIFNLINGGEHGLGNLDFQEFHIIAPRSQKFHQALEVAQEAYNELKTILIYKNISFGIGEEGGFTPNLLTNLDAIDLLVDALENCSLRLNADIFLGLDIAASTFSSNDVYVIKDKTKPFSKEQFIEFLINLNNKYRMYSLEDALNEDDWSGWRQITEKLGENTLIVGDDFICTNKKRLLKAIEKGACNALLVKPNQVGTITETVEAVYMAKGADFKIIVSHRSGETNEDFIADFAVGVGADFTKFGAPVRGERIIKYNRLLKIEEEISQRY